MELRLNTTSTTNRKMKILQLGKFWPVKGGVEKVMFDLTRGLAEREGMECDMMAAAIDGASRTEKLNDGARLLLCRTWRKAAATMLAPSMIVRLRSVASEYDIIHVHHPDPMAALALRLSGFKGKVVLHWHSDILKQRQLLKLYMPLQQWLLRRADMVVGTSPVYLAESPHLSDVQNKTVCLPIGVDPTPIDVDGAERIHRRYPGKKLVFSLGRLVPYKGYKYLVEAARHLPDDYMVLIGGEGPLRDELQRQISMLGIGHKVELLGGVPAKDVAAYFSAASLFCLSSVMKTEAFGIVLIEAMSAGVPVVTTTIDGSGTQWVNEHGTSGINVPPCSPIALAKGIIKVASDAEARRRFAEGALTRYSTLFTHKKMIDNVIDIYNKVLY